MEKIILVCAMWLKGGLWKVQSLLKDTGACCIRLHMFCLSIYLLVWRGGEKIIETLCSFLVFLFYFDKGSICILLIFEFFFNKLRASRY
jgi:hypothetical protein